ncbi:wHTH domain-containing protein [Streptomyces sp. CB00072]|uniref:wHTH domain-containing protein n=1 Tax=Streptomyces sp. CB00072 TaxID=1703928 RepID=UPI0011612B6B|nr:ATP-binding protein [Streptomyces sp. CB00072]
MQFQQDQPDGGDAALHTDPWIQAAVHSSVWDHVPPTRDLSAFRNHVIGVMEKLTMLRDGSHAALASDPWQDPGMAVRFAERVEWLLGEPNATAPLDLYAAEAALLVLAPFLYAANCMRVAARYASVNPEILENDAHADADRVSFEAFVEEHSLLVNRTVLRPEAAVPVGWWIFHRWLLHRGLHADRHGVQELIGLLGGHGRALGEVLSPDRLVSLLHGVRRGPDVTNPEFLERLPSDDRVRAPGHQRIRDQRLALIIALAYGTCADMATMPDIVAEHLGIPRPVDLDRLRETLEHATWGGQPFFPVLRADCHHEAVIEGLRAHVARADDILHRVHRTARERLTHPMPVLPTRLSADDVRPANRIFDGWASFRLDERRVREMLMGVQLYKDQNLAVRELYQNALDACRYRRARTEYLDRTEPMSYSYEGRITFEQASDANGRLYLECGDNGIGMGDAELRGVFSQAGARFADQPDFKLERTAWGRLDPPVELFPNSRFGIGVLSYFMLADELTVTTCRMGLDGRPGPVFEASIHGPGHLFRIAKTAEQGTEPGTRIRLYPREAPTAEGRWSSIDVLDQLLGIAEFPTSVRDGGRHKAWEVGRLHSRKQPSRERFGLNAHGDQVHWPEAPPGVQVTWTEHGGGLLVDGLVVQPAHRKGVLSSSQSGLTGVVVNLTGAYAPARLSADRAQVLDDVSPLLHNLLIEASKSLASQEEALPEFTWVTRIAYESPELADLLTKSLLKTERRLSYGPKNLDIRATGILPSDMEGFTSRRTDSNRQESPWRIAGEPPDHIYLWRIIAHNDERILNQLTEFFPDIIEATPVLVALPSDQLLLSEMSRTGNYWHWTGRSYESRTECFLSAIEKWNLPPRQAAFRAAHLGIHDLRPEGFPDQRTELTRLLPLLSGSLNHQRSFLSRSTKPGVQLLASKAAQTDLSPREVASFWNGLGVQVSDQVIALAEASPNEPLLLRDSEAIGAGFFDPADTVPLGRIAQASAELDISVTEICDRYQRYGLRAEPGRLTGRADSMVVKLLRDHCVRQQPWLVAEKPMPPAQVLIAARELKITPAAALRKYHELGLDGPIHFPFDATMGDLSLFKNPYGDDPVWVAPGPIPYQLILDAAQTDRPLRDVITRLRKYGFTVPMVAPEIPDELDAQLLSASSPCSWWDVYTGESMPYAHVLAAARATFHNPQEIARKIESYGIPLSCTSLPPGLSSARAHELLSFREEEGMYLSKESELPLQDLLERAAHCRVPLAQAVDWLTQLGLSVPNLGNTIREALIRLPRPQAPDH